MTTATSLQPGTLLQQREIYLSILKDLTIMDDIFMRNVLKDSACTEYILKVIMDQDNLKLKDQIRQDKREIRSATYKIGEIYRELHSEDYEEAYEDCFQKIERLEQAIDWKEDALKNLEY